MEASCVEYISEHFPQFQCHKKVWAAKIIEIVQVGRRAGNGELYEDVRELRFEEPLLPAKVEGRWVGKYEPKVGGYYVVYPDGYESFSPADAFESGYTLIDKTAVPDEDGASV